MNTLKWDDDVISSFIHFEDGEYRAQFNLQGFKKEDMHVSIEPGNTLSVYGSNGNRKAAYSTTIPRYADNSTVCVDARDNVLFITIQVVKLKLYRADINLN